MAATSGLVARHPVAALVGRGRWARAAGPVAVAAVLGVVWTLVGTVGHDDRDDAAPPPSVVLRHVGAPRTTALDGDAGAATLHVVAELRGAATVHGAAAPLGAPLTLTVETRASDGGTMPTLTAERVTADGRPADPGVGPEELARHETFLFDHTDGTFALRDGAGATAGSLGHAADASVARPVPAGGAAWVTALGPHTGAVLTDPTGRWVAVAQPQAGRVDLVDLVGRAGPLAAPLLGRPTAMAFAPDGTTLWVATDGSGLVGVDLPTAEVHRVAGVGDAHAVAVNDDGTLVLVIGTDGQARLVDAATRRVTGMRPASADVVEARYVASLDGGAFVCVGRGGLVRVLPVRGHAFGTDRVVETGPAGERDVGGALVAPDGRTLLLSDRIADEIVVVDLAAGAVTGTLAAGTDPTDVVRLGHLALVRHAGGTGATWVDLDDPTRSGSLAIGTAAPGRFTVAAGAAEVLVPVPAEQRLYRVRLVDGRAVTAAPDPTPTAADVAIDVLGALHGLAPGRYEQRTRFDTAGRYRIVLTVAGHRATWELSVG